MVLHLPLTYISVSSKLCWRVLLEDHRGPGAHHLCGPGHRQDDQDPSPETISLA